VASTYEHPGVYIEEVVSAGAIQGVGTSTAGFIGRAEGGPVATPIFVSSFDDFTAAFGPAPGVPAKPQPGFFLWYAVRGYFENGGRAAWIVRASGGRAATLGLDDSRTTGAEDVLTVTARQVGAPATAPQVSVARTTSATAKALRADAPIGQLAGVAVKVDPTATPSAEAAAAQFRPGDRVTLKKGTSTTEDGVVASVAGAVITLEQAPAMVSPASLRLADPAIADTALRLDDTGAALAPGTLVELKQGSKREYATVERLEAQRIDATKITYRVTFKAPLTNGYSLTGTTDLTLTSQDFTLTVTADGRTETRTALTVERSHPRYVATVLAADPFTAVTVTEPVVPTTAAGIDRLPKALTTLTALAGGVADDPAQPLGLSDWQLAIDSLRVIDDVNFIAMPDGTGPGEQLALLAHCRAMWDRVAIFDPPQGLTPRGPGASVVDRAGLLADEDGFGALYYPWLTVAHPERGTIDVPPSGHVAGIWARADTEQGVHKAPANYLIGGAQGVERKLTDAVQGPLNVNGVNCLRILPGTGRPTVWGARTTSGAGHVPFQYVSTRRLFLYIEESIEQGIRWAVFQPNNLALWAGLRRTITQFLTNVWRSGALFGEKPEDAFYVRIDEALNPIAERELGRLSIEIGLKPVYPAEFIIVRIGFWHGESNVIES
jgi:phage tail sheath protein FI